MTKEDLELARKKILPYLVLEISPSSFHKKSPVLIYTVVIIELLEQVDEKHSNKMYALLNDCLDKYLAKLRAAGDYLDILEQEISNIKNEVDFEIGRNIMYREFFKTLKENKQPLPENCLCDLIVDALAEKFKKESYYEIF